MTEAEWFLASLQAVAELREAVWTLAASHAILGCAILLLAFRKR